MGQTQGQRMVRVAGAPAEVTARSEQCLQKAAREQESFVHQLLLGSGSY